MRDFSTFVLACALCLSANTFLYGQIQILPESIDVENSDVNTKSINYHSSLDMHEWLLNFYGHTLSRNNESGKYAADEYWHLGARNTGNFDVAFGNSSTNNVVSTANAVMTFTQDGEVGIGTNDPEDKLHVAGGDVRISDTNPRLDIISDGTFNPVLGLGGNGGGANATIVYDPSDDQLILSTIASAGNLILDRKVGVNERNNLNAQMTIKANSGTVSTPVQLELRENNNSDFARLRFSQFSVDGHWDIAGVAEPDGSLLGDPKLNFYYQTGSGGFNIMSIDGDDKRVGINKTNPVAFLHIKQAAEGPGLIIENNGQGNDEWGFDVGANDLTVTYDGTDVGYFDEASGSYISTSDRRLKNTITYLQEGALQQVMALRPATYYYQHDQERSKPTYGFIAQEVQDIEPKLVHQREDDYLALNYDEFIPVLTKAIQEQQQIIEEKDQRITELESRLTELERTVNRLAENTELPALEGGAPVLVTDAELFQNEPNPFNGRTAIRYRIPDGAKQATLRITNAQGQVIRDLNIEERGSGQVELNAQILSTGAYQYSLFLDGRLIDTKRMIRQ